MVTTLSRRCAPLVLFLPLMLLPCVWPQRTAAVTYGRDSFGSCNYQKTCKVTKSILPSGLQVAVNLTDGQTIPANGYTIVVTPLNGAGVSFQKAEFYIDGVLIQTATPDDTGTVRWFWNPQELPGTKIKVVVTAADGTAVTQEFTVAVGAAGVAPAPHAAVPPQPAPKGAIATAAQAVSHALQQAYSSAKQVVRALPKPVTYSFPYALLALLGINVLVLLLQTKRELREYHTLQTLLVRERSATESKKTLLALTAHYLRTPIALVLNGIDMLGTSGGEAVINLRRASQQLHANIEALLTQIPTLEYTAETGPAGGAGGLAVWRQPGLFLPPLLIAMLVIPFNYVARNAGTLDVSEINLGIQLVVFILLALLSYQVFRRLQLHRRDAAQLRHLDRAEQASNRARDELIASMATSLRTDIVQLDRLTAQLPSSRATTFILSGESRLHDVLAKLSIAQQLKGGRSQVMPRKLTLESLLGGSTMQSLHETATGRNVTIQLEGGDTLLGIRNQELFSFALRSVLDNAVAYSQDGNTVRVAASTAAGGDAVVTIEDQGSGIPAAKLPLLFQPFSKAEGAEIFNHEGMGFSLYLDKFIMNYLGGGISLRSKPGRGTVVTLTLSAGAPAAS